jgi:hypothetical protein
MRPNTNGDCFRFVMPGQKRVEDARKRAYDPGIHLLCRKVYEGGWIAPQLGLARVAQLYAPQIG